MTALLRLPGPRRSLPRRAASPHGRSPPLTACGCSPDLGSHAGSRRPAGRRAGRGRRGSGHQRSLTAARRARADPNQCEKGARPARPPRHRLLSGTLSPAQPQITRGDYTGGGSAPWPRLPGGRGGAGNESHSTLEKSSSFSPFPDLRHK